MIELLRSNDPVLISFVVAESRQADARRLLTDAGVRVEAGATTRGPGVTCHTRESLRQAVPPVPAQ